MQDAIARMKFVVGLGNPGDRYAGTRHNLGFRVLERLRQLWQVNTQRRAFGGLVCEARAAGTGQAAPKVLMMAPQTYMNRCGQAVRQMVAFYKAQPSDLLVVLDDAALPLGRLRARAAGSAGGHNGLADVIEALGCDEVQRLRIGIGSPPGDVDLTDYVLRRFSAEEEQAIGPAVAAAAEAVCDWVSSGIVYVMDKYNRKSSDQDE